MEMFVGFNFYFEIKTYEWNEMLSFHEVFLQNTKKREDAKKTL